MSYTTIKSVWPGERADDIEELRNSHGSAPVIWGDMGQRYLGCGRFEVMWGSNADNLWPLWKRKDIPLHHRAVLALTYDNVLLMKADYARAAADIRAYMKDFPPQSGYVNHWSRIAEILESSPDCPAIGFHWTSVCEDPFQGDYNEDREDYDQPDWSKYWDMYAYLDKAESASNENGQRGSEA
jgi:hypothetical protein